MRTAAALLLLVVAARAAAAPELAACRKAYEDQRFEEATRLCAAVGEDPAAERRAIAAAWEVAGMADLVLGRAAAAKAAFCKAVIADPAYRPTDPIYPARFVAVYEAVHAAGCKAALRVEVTPTRAGVRVRVHGTAPAQATVEVRHRSPGGPAWERADAPARGGEPVSIALPAAGELEYYVLLLAGGRALARSGTPDHPLRLAVLATARTPEAPPAETPSWLRRNWLWVAIGGAAGVALITAIAVAASGPYGSNGALATFRLP